jgi:hypothetical protein
MAAYSAGLARNWSEVLAAVASSRNETASLRELAGHARWSLRQLRSARAEYEAALAATSDPAVSERLRGNLASVAQDLELITRAEKVAVRNGWLQGVLCVVMLVLGLACLRR